MRTDAARTGVSQSTTPVSRYEANTTRKKHQNPALSQIPQRHDPAGHIKAKTKEATAQSAGGATYVGIGDGPMMRNANIVPAARAKEIQSATK
jgi:hypothetical protein